VFEHRLTNRGDQREPHHSGTDVSLERLSDLGVIYQEIPIDEAGEWEKKIDVFAKERGYKNVSPQAFDMGDCSRAAGPYNSHEGGARRNV
jgi:cupin superfamily acireductone dioxygenase involved in methionine salvage